MDDHFDMVCRPHGRSNTYRMQVEVTLRSEQLIRFRITAGEKSITMEKHLHKKTGAWKILDSNIDFTHQPAEQTAYTLFEMQNWLDAYMKKDEEKGNPKWE